MNTKPRLRQVRPSSPFRPLFDALNRAVSDQAGLRVGPGLGMSTGPFGPTVSRTSQDWMAAYTFEDGAPAAIVTEDGTKWELGKGYALECTLEIDEDEKVSIVLAKPSDVDEAEDAATRLTYYNPGTTGVEGNTLVFLEKKFGLWMPTKPAGGVARAKVTTAIPTGTFDSPSDAGRAQIYHKTADGDWEESGDPVKVYNDHVLSSSIPVDATIKIASIDGDWYLITADCPTEG